MRDNGQAGLCRALLLLGTVLGARGDVKGSVSALERAIRLRPDLPAPHRPRANAARAGDEQGARRESAKPNGCVRCWELAEGRGP